MNKPKDRAKIREMLEEKYEHVFDPENPPKVLHNWVERGIKLSCEGAGHPHHFVYKKIR